MEKTFELPDSIVRPEEMDFYVQSLRPFYVHEIGTPAWIKSHESIIKLNQQAHLEMNTHQEELVKELLVMHDKLPLLVHEIYSILVWRSKVLPKLLDLEAQPKATFALYTVLFHEATTVSLLEGALFHANGCEALAESCLDIIDYCAYSTTRLVGLVEKRESEEFLEAHNEGPTEELERQQRDLFFKIGLRCLSILGYIVDKLDVLPLSAASRLVQVHDIPCVLSQVLHSAPWRRRSERGVENFIEEKWTTVTGDAVLKFVKVEAQTWLCFRQLMFHPSVSRQYTINDFRQREISRCQGLLNDILLDQLPPLSEFKHYLCTLQVTGHQKKNNQSLLLEELPLIKERIVERVMKMGGFKRIVQLQAEIFLNKDQDQVVELAKQLNDAYGTDVWASAEAASAAANATVTEHQCAKCEQLAYKKCFQCKEVYYCCQECQVADWPQHKEQCCKSG